LKRLDIGLNERLQVTEGSSLPHVRFAKMGTIGFFAGPIGPIAMEVTRVVVFLAEYVVNMAMRSHFCDSFME
jgi:hypothetical protein